MYFNLSYVHPITIRIRSASDNFTPYPIRIRSDNDNLFGSELYSVEPQLCQPIWFWPKVDITEWLTQLNDCTQCLSASTT